MSWITNYVRPKIRALVKQRDVPENLWQKCPKCGQMLFQKDLEQNMHVCTHCGAHLRIGPKLRLQYLFDGGDYHTIELPKTAADPLKFRDQKRYSDRLKDAQTKTGANDAIVVAHGLVGGLPVVCAAFDFSFMGGSMGVAVGEGVVAAAKLAVLQNATLIVVPASGGARMQEGILSLMQMPRTVIATQLVKDAGLPYIVLLTRPDHGRRIGLFRHAGRHPDCRTRCADRLCRRSRDRGNHPRNPARRLPAGGIPCWIMA